MADIKKITLPSGDEYDIKDEVAREAVKTKQGALSEAQLEAVNSGITAEKVAMYDAITTLFDAPEIIPSNADLNDYMTPGHYAAHNGTIAGSLANCPTTANFSLYVIPRTTTLISQIIIAASNTLYYRYESSSGLSAWRKISTTAV